jgi:hypothetical protein
MHQYVPNYLLRWRFEWADKPTKCGMWSTSAAKNDDANQAWNKNTTGLLWAMVEAKNYINRADQKIVVAVPGQDFMLFQWLALGIVGMRHLKIQNNKATTLIGGLKILTRYEEICVYDCGKVLRGPHDNHNVNFAAFGK